MELIFICSTVHVNPPDAVFVYARHLNASCFSTQMEGGEIRWFYLMYYRDSDQPEGTEWVIFGDTERKMRIDQGFVPRCLRDVKIGEGVFKR